MIADALFSLAGCLMASRFVFCFSVSVEFYNSGFQSPSHLKCHRHFLLCSLKHSRQWGCYTEQHKAHFIDRLNQCREKKMINETTVWPTRIKALMNTILGSSWPLKAKIDRFKQRVRTLTLILLLLALVSSRGKRWYNVVCRPSRHNTHLIILTNPGTNVITQDLAHELWLCAYGRARPQSSYIMSRIICPILSEGVL